MPFFILIFLIMLWIAPGFILIFCACLLGYFIIWGVKAYLKDRKDLREFERETKDDPDGPYD